MVLASIITTLSKYLQSGYFFTDKKIIINYHKKQKSFLIIYSFRNFCRFDSQVWLGDKYFI